MNFNIRSIVFINGIVTCCLSMIMLVPLLCDVLIWNGKSVSVFLPSIIAGVFFGGLMIFSCFSKSEISFSKSEIFVLVASIWIVSSIVSAFPFYVCQNNQLSFMSALFESVSGITTTGCSVYTNVEALPRALNLWRFILHFVGGVGIVAIGIFLLPIMRIGGMQLFLTENSDKSQKILPRASQVVGFFIGIYVVLITIFSALLKFSGMPIFDSVCHAISAISTGGFSTKNSGIFWFQNIKAELVMSVAMFIGGITILEIVRCFRYGLKSFWNNQQTRFYFKIVIITIIIPLLVAIANSENIAFKDISAHIFQIVSAITTTGLDYANEYVHPKMLLVLLAIMGGCSGSTSGGIKIFRVQILGAVLRNHLRKLITPFDVSVPKFQNKKIDDTLLSSVVSFIFALGLTFIVSVGLIELISGKSASESVYCVTSCLFNLGYDFDLTASNEFSKFILICNMIIGRLEVIPLFIILRLLFSRK